MSNENKKLKRMQVRANNLYREVVSAIQDVNEAIGRFYDRSGKYVKLLKKIEKEITKSKK